MGNPPFEEFSNIHAHSAFSFQDGVCTPEEMVLAAKQCGLRSIAITDHGHAHAHADFHFACQKHDFKGLFGVEAYVIHSIDEWRETKERLKIEKAARKSQAAEDMEVDLEDAALQDREARRVLNRKGHLVLLAQDQRGLSNIYQIIHKAHKHGMYMKPRADKDILRQHRDGVIASSACMGGVVSAKIWAMQRGEVEWSDVVREALDFDDIFGRGKFFLEVQGNEHDNQRVINSHMARIHEETGIPLIFTLDSHYVKEDDWEAQQLLHLLMTHRGKRKLTMGTLPEDYEFTVRSLFVKSGQRAYEDFIRWNPDFPIRLVDQAFANTLLVDSMIEPYRPDTTPRLPTLPVADPVREMADRALDGLKARGLQSDERYTQRFLYELQVIRDKGISPYFLVVKNIVDEAKKTMLIGPGRGSAAGSLMCYLLGITNIDPIEHGLMFERFINMDRVELPDIDLDFEDVDQVKETLRGVFGEDNVACISAYGTSQIKGLMKDVARIHDIDHNEVNRANAAIESEMFAIFKEKEGETRSTIVLKLEDIYRLSPTFRAFMDKYPQMEKPIERLYGRPHHVSRHASGVVIGDNLPAETAVFYAGSAEKRVLQASFTDGIVGKNLSNMGLVKFDILSLATLKVIRKTCELLSRQTGRPVREFLDEIEPKNLNFNDMRVMEEVFWKGNLTGIFQASQKGMRRLLMQVRPESFNDVSAVCALYRPGPLGSGMDQMYARRKNGEEAVSYDHPILESILGDTYGCLIYQEQMLEIGRQLGNMSWKDVNRLRKLFLKKDKSRQDDAVAREETELKAKLIAGVVSHGMTEAQGEELWEMCGKFGGYGFNTCLTGDTVVVRSSGNQHCSAEVSLRELWDNQESRVNGRLTPIAKKMRRNGLQILQLDEDGRIRPGKMTKVIYSGVAPVFCVITQSGRKIKATENHRFLTIRGFVRLDELRIGDELICEEIDQKLSRGPDRRCLGKSYTGEGFPAGRENPGWIDGRTGLFEEAKIYVRERASGICERCGVEPPPKSHALEFAHTLSLAELDGDYIRYHSPDNIRHLCNSCHKTFDYQKGERKARWTKGRQAGVDEVSLIIAAGNEEVFDVVMDTEGHNFIANGIVSHNSHAKSYGMVTMQTAYLRTYHPVEFLAAVLACGQTGEIQEDVDDIRRQGFRVLPVDINESRDDFGIEQDAIRLSLGIVKGVGKSAISKIMAGQPYANFLDFLYRSGATKTSITPLLRVGAFSRFSENPALLIHGYELYQSLKGSTKKGRDKFEMAYLEADVDGVEPVSILQLSLWERELLSFNLIHSPFTMNGRGEKVQSFRDAGVVMSYDEFVESDLDTAWLCVFLKEWRERPQKNKHMMAFLKFGTEDGREFESPAFSGVWGHVRNILREGDLYIVAFNRKDGDPHRLIVGKPGWSHGRMEAAGYFIRIDDLE